MHRRADARTMWTTWTWTTAPSPHSARPIITEGLRSFRTELMFCPMCPPPLPLSALLGLPPHCFSRALGKTQTSRNRQKRSFFNGGPESRPLESSSQADDGLREATPPGSRPSLRSGRSTWTCGFAAADSAATEEEPGAPRGRNLEGAWHCKRDVLKGWSSKGRVEGVSGLRGVSRETPDLLRVWPAGAPRSSPAEVRRTAPSGQES